MSYDPQLLRDVCLSEQLRRKTKVDKNIEKRLDKIDSSLCGEFIEFLNKGGEFVLNEKLLAERERLLPDDKICKKCNDGLFIKGKPCTCLHEAYIKAQLKELSGVLDIKKMNFDNFNIGYYSEERDKNMDNSPRKIIEIWLENSCDFIEHFDENPRNLFLNGPVGTGKTFLSACIAKAVAEKGFWVIYAPAIKLFSVLEACRFNRDDADFYLAKAYMSCDLLILDDLGSEFLTPLITTLLYQVIEERKGKSTIISSNWMTEDLNARYSAQIMSRVNAYYELMYFFGEDLRNVPPPTS